jgi:TetR/AcrR family transcriptional regulator
VALEGLVNAFLFCWLEDPERHPYEANIPVIRDIFLKGVLAE